VLQLPSRVIWILGLRCLRFSVEQCVVPSIGCQRAAPEVATLAAWASRLLSLQSSGPLALLLAETRCPPTTTRPPAPPRLPPPFNPPHPPHPTPPMQMSVAPRPD